MDNKCILLVDDEPKIIILLKDFLEMNDCEVLTAENGREALSIIEANKEMIDLVLLDVMMPGMDGWTTCRELKKMADIPVIMLTARSDEYDEIHGFEIGADDYVTKPVRPGVLMARMNAMLRRFDKAGSNIYQAAGIMVDNDSHIVSVNGEVINLSPKEYTMLLVLMDHSKKVVSREQLLNQVWRYDYYGGLRTVDTHINRLRMKLGSCGASITAVRGFGYRFEVLE